MTNLELTVHRGKAKPILISLYVYIVWSLVTYLLEGRIHLLQRLQYGDDFSPIGLDISRSSNYLKD